MEDGVRTHDKFYLKENYKTEPKEYYKLVKSEIEKNFHGLLEGRAILDVGCETGSFLHYLRESFPSASLTGLDVMQELLDEVNKPNDIGAVTINADISSQLTISEKYDAVTMLGVLGIFDDYEKVIDNLVSLISDDGCVYIFSAFNPEDLDMIMRCRRSNDDGEWEKGWNVFSLETIRNYCEHKGWKHEIIEFHMPFAIEKRTSDPLRSWTVTLNGEMAVINGLQLLHNFYLFKIWK